jgi:hypothetical protein
MASQPSSSACSACSQWRRKVSPSLVSRRLRVERTNSGAPRARSSRLSDALAAAGVVSSCRAAADKLPERAVRTNSRRSVRDFIFNEIVKVNPNLPAFHDESGSG